MLTRMMVFAGVACALMCAPALGTTSLAEYAFNLNGSVSNPTLGDPVPAGVNLSGFNTTTGLGTIQIAFFPGAAGNYQILSYLDLEIDAPVNTFFNEYGFSSGTPAAGQSWEIDEPGFATPAGDIYVPNFLAGTLDNSVGIPTMANPDDVSIAFGWDFALTATELAVITVTATPEQPASGFFLGHVDPDSDESVFYTSDLRIGEQVIPEPVTMIGCTMGLAGIAGYLRKRNRK